MTEYPPEQQLTISVITPSLNQATFLATCLASVRDQTYPPLEHFVCDPGSTDGSRELAASFPHVTLIAEADTGQSDAINQGMQRAAGDIIAWINSDDYYATPDVFARVVARFQQPDAPDMVYGNAVYVDENGVWLRNAFVNDAPDTLPWTLHYQVGLIQPAVFIKRAAMQRVGLLRADLHFALDYDYWIRCVKAGITVAYLDEQLAVARYHLDNKTYGQRDKSYAEICALVKTHFGYVNHVWLRSYAEYLVEGYDGIMTQAATHDLTNEAAVVRTYRQLLRAYNTDYDAYRVLQDHARERSYRDTWQEMQRLGIAPAAPVQPVPVGKIAPADHSTFTVGSRQWAIAENWLQQQIARSRVFLQGRMQSRQHDTCVIVGNGPSLQATDLALLAGHDVIISNNAFLSEELLKHATYFTVVNYLVAEQSSAMINRLEGVAKIVPCWLAYCIQPDERTYFVNATGHRQFSTDIFENMSWRHTVSFFNMQLAYGLGYRKVVLIGFDHSYVQPPGVVEGAIIDQTTDDENHFDPTYFKGKKWQAADVAKMEEVYLLAREAFAADGREIVNCTVGGQLEVFRRGDLQHELDCVSSRPDQPRTETLPRTLIIDMTAMDSLSATGQLKSTLFADFPPGDLLQVFAVGDEVGLYVPASQTQQIMPLADIRCACQSFNPAVIYYRPVVETPQFDQLVQFLIDQLHVPLVMHIMDDWIERLRYQDAAAYASADHALRHLLAQADGRLSISTKMAAEYERRYGLTFVPVANCITPDHWPTRAMIQQRAYGAETFTIRYMGGLAEDMTYTSVVEIAQAVDRLQDTVACRFEIYTMPYWKANVLPAVQGLRGVAVYDSEPALPDYQRLLTSADAMVIAYNFDEVSIRYTRLSMANKLPECMASGAVLLAYGPLAIHTIDYLRASEAAVVVSTQGVEQLAETIRELATAPERCRTLALAAHDFVCEQRNCHRTRQRFQDVLLKAASQRRSTPADRAAHDDPPPAQDPLPPLKETASVSKGFWRNRLTRIMTYYAGPPGALALAIVLCAGLAFALPALALPLGLVSALLGLALVGNAVIGIYQNMTRIGQRADLNFTNVDTLQTEITTITDELSRLKRQDRQIREQSSGQIIDLDAQVVQQKKQFEAHRHATQASLSLLNKHLQFVERYSAQARRQTLRFRHDTHLFILGNGPSLRDFDFHRLSGFDTLGMNAAYRHWDRIDWYPTYYCCMDTTVIMSHADEIYRLIQEQDQNGIRLFFLRETILERYPSLLEHPAVLFLEYEREYQPVLQARRITTGGQSALWGVYLGYTELYLLGIDLNYVEVIDDAALIEGSVLEITQTPDHNPNYFFDDYQQAGDRYHLPNPNPDSPVQMASWHEVQTILQDTNISITNCNPQSALRIFPVMDLDVVLDQLDAPPPLTTLPEFAHLSRQMTHLEKRIADQSTQLATQVTSRVTQLEGQLTQQMTRLEGQIAQQMPHFAAQYQTLQTRLAALGHHIQYLDQLAAQARRQTLRFAHDTRLLIVGNGPSLRDFDFHRLDSFDTVGMNAAYRHWDRIGWYPTYYCCMDTVVMLSHADAIYRLIQERAQNGIRLFFLREAILERYPVLRGHPAVFFLEQEQTYQPLLQAQPITTGGHAVLWGVYLGYTDLYLLGIDLNYMDRINGTATVDGPSSDDPLLEMTRTPAQNPNYFFDDYQQIGDRFPVPNPDPAAPTHRASWQAVQAVIQGTGVTVTNCNAQSALQLFSFMDLDLVLNQFATQPPAALSPEFAALTHHVTQLEEQIAQQVTHFENELAQQVAQLEDQVADQMKAAQQELKLDLVASGALTKRSYAHFSRGLTEQDMQTFTNEWSKKLGFKLTRQPLAYMVNRINTAENMCRGRLATNVQDILLRALIVRSVPTTTIRILEIGTLFGLGAGLLYDLNRDYFETIQLTLIDPLTGYYQQGLRDIITDQPVNERILRENLQTLGVPPAQVDLIPHYSTDDAAIARVHQAPVDVMVVDGDHSYAGVKMDCELYLDTVERGGYLILDDYQADDWPEVTRFVDEELRQHEQLVFVGAGWRTAVFRKIV
ncbi:MAG: glycosyltransferase [Anaerolineae bacterium]|nr:glycosyltransferase [Anaerolineae bacterium]